MRAWAILFLGMMVGTFPLRAACGGEPTVRDWGLHREWVVVGDCGHPERPPQLREIDWRKPAAQAPRPSADEPAQQEERSAVAPRPPDLPTDWLSHRPGERLPDGGANEPPEVRAGMQVNVSRRDADAEVFLVGTAMGTARIGEKVEVRLGLHSAVVRGIVRGPAIVELIPGRVER